MNRIPLRCVEIIGGMLRVPGLGEVSRVLTGANPTSAGPTIDCSVWLYPEWQLVEIVCGFESAMYHTAYCRMWTVVPIALDAATPTLKPESAAQAPRENTDGSRARGKRA